MRNNKKLYSLTSIIIGLAILRGLIYCVLIPFDHAPDEKHHLLLIKAKQLQLGDASNEEAQATAARVEAAWYALLYPEASVSKQRVTSFEGNTLPSPPPSRQIYYLVTAGILNLCSLDDVRNEIYLLRGFSILCGALVVGFAVLIAQELFPDDRLIRLGIPFFITFVPQFSAMNGVINNDKLAEVFTSLLFLIIVNIFKQGISWQYGLAYPIATVLALFSKRTTYFILPLSLLMLLLYFWNGRLGLKMHLLLIGGMFGVIFAIYLFLWNPTIYTLVHDHVISIPEARDLPKAVFRPELFTAATLLHIAKFFTVMYWGFWGIFGYMTIHLHHFWYVAAACVQGLALIGLGVVMIRTKRHIRPFEQWKAKVCYLFGASIALSLIIPVFRSIILLFGTPDLTQGRYLFTVMIPVGVLTMLGLAALFPPKYHRIVGGLGLFALIILDSVALFHYILLNFHYAALF